MGGSDDFVNVWTSEEKDGDSTSRADSFHRAWNNSASEKHSAPDLIGLEALKKAYPNHSITMSEVPYTLNLLAFPQAIMVPLAPSELITNVAFVPLQRKGPVPGVLIDSIRFGGFKMAWDKYEFIVYIVPYPKTSMYFETQMYILHDGPSEDPARQMLLAAGAFFDELHDEIWVFESGYWSKDHDLWVELQKANWKDVILKEDKKKKLRKDVYGFFESEAIYKELAIPWKRGIIMFGPPGNGKTISIKAIMKTCDDKGFKPLYVKSFKSFFGEERSMASVFAKARQLAPCVIVLEDLDALINDGNRSFFLNQMDGLSGNDGLLVIGTTNHFERLDPGLSTRPSRFDRKYNFDDPDQDERFLYVQYWQKKLKDNKEISFPDSLAEEIAKLTSRFSFAYLKEAFVSTLVQLAGLEGEKPLFGDAIKKTITDLRKQLDKASARSFGNKPATPTETGLTRDVKIVLDALSDNWEAKQTTLEAKLRAVRNSLEGVRVYDTAPTDTSERSIRALLDTLSVSGPRVGGSDDRRIRASDPDQGGRVYDLPAGENANERSIRALLDALAESAASRNQPARMYDAGNPFM